MWGKTLCEFEVKINMDITEIMVVSRKEEEINISIGRRT